MSYQLKDNIPALVIKTKANAVAFLRIACDVLVETAEPYTPKDKGNLRRDTLKQVLGLKGQVRWRKVYAAFQERGRRYDGSHKVRNYTTPGTGAHFAENAAKKIPHKTHEIALRSGLI